jgi:hypothetical protein
MAPFACHYVRGVGNGTIYSPRQTEMTIRVPVLFSLVSLVFGLTARGTEQPQDVPAGEFVRRVVTHELKAEEQDQSNWLFRLDIEKPNGQKEVDEVVETKQGDLTRPILINGRELTAEERQKADKRLQQIARNPGALQKSLNDKNQDAARSRRLLKLRCCPTPSSSITESGKVIFNN